MTPEQHTFHLEEFKHLKSELSGLMSSAQTLMRYAIVVSAAVFAWLAVQGIGQAQGEFCVKLPKEFVKLAWFIPLGFSIFGGVTALIGVIRLFDISRYLRTLEREFAMGSHGWEAYLRTRPYLLTGLGTAFWLLLMVVNGIVAVKVSGWIDANVTRTCF